MTRRVGTRRWVGLGLLVTAAVSALAVAVWGRADPDATYERALGALEAGRFDQAEASLARLAREREPTVLDWGIRARLAMARGRTDPALEALAKIPESHPLSGWAHLRAGQLELRRARLRFAEAELRRALAREPGPIEARRELIYVLGLQLRRGELREQFARLAESSRLTPHEVWVWSMAPDLMVWTPEEHASLLEEALQADPDDRWSRLTLAENQHRQARYAEAEALLAPLPLSDPEVCATRAGLALESIGPEAAAELLARGPADHPRLAGVRGRLALWSGDVRAAVRFFETALAAEPGSRRTNSDLARAWVAAGSRQKAEPYLEITRKIDALNQILQVAEGHLENPDPAYWRRLAAATEAAGRLPEARAWYRLIATQDPLDTEAQYALSRLGARSAEPRAQQEVLRNRK